MDNAAGKQEDFPDAPQQKYMEMEQKALKEKIEFLAQQYEEDQDGVKVMYCFICLDHHTESTSRIFLFVIIIINLHNYC